MRRFFSYSILLILLAACQKPVLQPHEETRFLMDTIVSISIYDQSIASEQLSAAFDSAFAAMQRVERQASIHVPDSEISRLVACAGTASLTLSEDVAALLRRSLELGDATDGAFDCSIGAVKALWPFQDENARPPAQSVLEAALKHVDYKKIQMEDRVARLPEKGMVLDLGGVAKGLAIDKAVEALQRMGITSALVNAGGDMRMLGVHPANDIWGIGIQQPRPGRGQLYAALRLAGGAVATSGDYERFFEYNGIRYHHLLNPGTGKPVRDAVSVTIVAGNALDADALATAVFVMGPERGMTFLESTPGIEGLIIYEVSGKLVHVCSRGLQPQLELIGGK